ncbi:hypothetical protein FH972_016886 [Carpinus fangiana]|uniref:Uncharacterized protein n=1 Tax=Carpinus fangiana TaxID=176857 RepID=A0A5N6RH99_9ROSI|nr:hypothetical protein FH972_016886 [Carpinus fangiana]
MMESPRPIALKSAIGEPCRAGQAMENQSWSQSINMGPVGPSLRCTTGITDMIAMRRLPRKGIEGTRLVENTATTGEASTIFKAEPVIMTVGALGMVTSPKAVRMHRCMEATSTKAK